MSPCTDKLLPSSDRRRVRPRRAVVTTEPDIAERLAAHLRMFGLDLDDTERAERAGAAADELAERLGEVLVERRRELVDLVDVGAWRYLLYQLPPETRRGMLSQLG